MYERVPPYTELWSQFKELREHHAELEERYKKLNEHYSNLLLILTGVKYDLEKLEDLWAEEEKP